MCIRDSPDVQAIVLICGGRTFFAGADITEFGKPPVSPTPVSYTHLDVYKRQDYTERHFSPLTQINAENIGQLGLGWSHDIDVLPSAQTAPVGVDGVLYFGAGHSVVHALDAKTGKELWRYDPEAPQKAGEKLRSAWGIRGIAYGEGRIYTGTVDGRLIALDAKTGALLWSSMTIEANDGRYISGPPTFFNGKVIIGHGGGDFAPVRGYVTAYDAKTGKQIWRFYTVPGDPAKGFCLLYTSRCV